MLLEKISKVISLKKFLLLLLPEIIILIPGIWYYPGHSETTRSTDINIFEFNINNIFFHFYQSFVSNMFWIFWIVFTISYILYLRFHPITNIQKSILLPVATAFFLYSIFICFLFVSTPCPRYNQLITIMYPFIFAAGLYLIDINIKKVSYTIGVLVSILLVTQNFITIDPTYFNLYNIDLGKTTIYSPSYNSIALDIHLDYVNELYAYNQQARYGIDLLNDIFSYYDLDQDTTILYSFYVFHDVIGAGRLSYDTNNHTVWIMDSNTTNLSYQGIDDPNLEGRCLLILSDQMEISPSYDIEYFIRNNSSSLIERRTFENFYGKYYVYLYQF